MKNVRNVQGFKSNGNWIRLPKMRGPSCVVLMIRILLYHGPCGYPPVMETTASSC